MASYNNSNANIVYIGLSGRLSELIMGIALSGTSVAGMDTDNIQGALEAKQG